MLQSAGSQRIGQDLATEQHKYFKTVYKPIISPHQIHLQDTRFEISDVGHHTTKEQNRKRGGDAK